MNTFDDCEPALQAQDLSAVEERIAHVIPESFKHHYMRYNGGTPQKAFFPGNDDWEPMQIAQFFPISYNHREPNLQRAVLEDKYTFLMEKGVIPSGLLPFANDHGGNFFCLDLHAGTVCFYATDAFDPAISAAENHAQAKRALCPSFENFLDALTTEDEAFDRQSFRAERISKTSC